jgi:hypothetical protein
VTTKVLSSSPISRARRKATAPPTAASCGRTNRQAAIQLEISPHRDGHRFESPRLHQEVRVNRRDFLRHRIPRHFSSLPRQGPVSVGGPAILRAIPGASCRKSLAANFRFQGCCLPHVHRARFRMWGGRTSTLDPVRIDGSPPAERQMSRGGSFLRLRPRLESERPPLIRPGRQIDETLETKAARQVAFDCRLDNPRREERERQGHPDRTLALALLRSDRFQRQAGIGEK